MRFSLLSCRALAWVLSFILVLILVPSAGSASQHPAGPTENASDPALSLSEADTTGVPPHFFPVQVSPLTAEEYDTDDSNGIETAADVDDLPNGTETVAGFDDLPGDPVDLIDPAEPDDPETDYIETDIEPQPEQDTTAATAGNLTIALTASGSSPTLADNAPDFDNNDYYYHNNVLYINSGTDMTISGSSVGEHIVVRAAGEDKNLTLYNVNIFNGNTSAFNMTGATVNLKLLGENFLTSLYNGAGLQAPDGSTLIIEGTGSLTVRGGEYCAGIGGSTSISGGSSGGNITIRGNVDISATGGYYGAGIGGGHDGSAGNITIRGNANVSTTGGYGAAGIGSRGSRTIGGNITISENANVSATGGFSAAGIGGHIWDALANVTISGGTVTAIAGNSDVNHRGSFGHSNEKIIIDMSPDTFRYWTNTYNTDPGGYGNIDIITPFEYSDSYRYVKIEQTSAANFITITTQPTVFTNVTEGSIIESLDIAAEVWPGGEPAYQWYSSTTASNSRGTLLVGQTNPRFAIPTGLTVGTHYFYCVVSADGAEDVPSVTAEVKVFEANLQCDLTISLTASGGSPQVATNAPYFDNNDYYYKYNILFINSGTEMTISGSSKNDYIVVRATGGDKNLTLHNVDIDMGEKGLAVSAFDMTSATVNLKLLGDNFLTSNYEHAGLQVPDGSNLIIEGTGSLTVKGGDRGAGIGSSVGKKSGSITILDGTVTAIGGSNSAGIGGGGEHGSASNITISGNADVSAIGDYNGAGIGGSYRGSGGNINIIENADVSATGGHYGPGIGAGYSGAGLYIANITISGNANVSTTGGVSAAGICGKNVTISENANVSTKGGFMGTGISGGFDNNITISGGTMTAIAGFRSGAAINGSNKFTINMFPNTFRYWTNTYNTDPGGYGTIDCFSPFVYANSYEYIKIEQLSEAAINITTQPAVNTNVTAGSINVSLEVAAEVWPGGEPAYQWYSSKTASNSGGTLLIGQTSPHFTIPIGLTAGVYFYYCVVSADGAEDVASNAAWVRVYDVNAAEAFITRMYLNVLEREPTQEWLEYWSSCLKADILTAADIFYIFFFSWEFLNRSVTDEEFIEITYKALMDREPDINGQTYWLNSLKNDYNGTSYINSRWHVLDYMMASWEFTDICGYSGITVGRMYPLPSSDGARNFVINMFRRILHREPGEEGLNYWTNGFISGGLTGASFIGHLFFSDEFLDANVSDLEFITIAYNALLVFSPDEDSLANWLEVLESGESRGAVLRDMAASPEFNRLCAQFGVTVGELNYE